MTRYEECDESLVKIFLDVLEERFSHLENLKFKLIFDVKKKVNKGNFVLADIALTSDKLKFFTKDNIAIDGYDYIITVNRKVWELANDKDKRRLISHELRHAFINEKGDCRLVGHEIEDFYEELKLNQDDPEWSRSLAQVVSDIYEQEKDAKKAN